jgi:hypothetical protein
METLLRDIPYAFRGIGKSPEFSLIAIQAFALGIGANAAISVVKGAPHFTAYSM